MGNIIDFTKFTFTAEQIRNVNELVHEELFKIPGLAELHTIHPGVIYDKEVGFIYGGGLVGKAAQGCNPVAQDWKINGRKVLWQPKQWEIYLEQCASDLKNTMEVYSMEKGLDMYNLENTDYIAIVVKFLTEAIYRMLYRIIWLSDVDALATKDESLPTASVSAQTGSTIVGTVYKAVPATTSSAVKCATSAKVVVWLNSTAASGAPESTATYYTKDTVHKTVVNNGGKYSNGIDVDYFNLINGLFKQCRAAVASDANQGYTIAANNESTKAAQMAAMTESVAYGIVSGMYYKAPMKLREDKARLRIMVTQTIADKYEQYLQGKGNVVTYDNLVNGVKTLAFNGVPVIPMPIWDEQIQSYQDLGTTFYKPHRALLTVKEVLAVGFASEDAFDEVSVFYDKKSRLNCIGASDKIDAKLANSKLLVYGE